MRVKIVNNEKQTINNGISEVNIFLLTGLLSCIYRKPH